MWLLATSVERYEAANKDLCNVDKWFDVEFDQLERLSKAPAKAQIKMDDMKEAAVAQKNVDQAMTQLSRTRNGCHSQTAMFDEA